MSDSLLVNAKEAASLLGVGRSLLYQMHSSGRLGPSPVRLGRTVRWRRSELKRWVDCGCPGRVKWIAIEKGA
jgi:excisionase family DNA binding protein